MLKLLRQETMLELIASGKDINGDTHYHKHVTQFQHMAKATFRVLDCEVFTNLTEVDIATLG